LRIRVFGRLSASRDGLELDLGPARQRYILGTLAAAPDVNVSQAALIELLWPGQPPDSAGAMLHRYIWRLRNALANGSRGARARQLITTDGGCYRLNTEHAYVDVKDFQRLASRARQAEPGDPGGAIALYERAAGLCPGEALTDIDYLSGQPPMAALEASRDALILSFARLAVRLGQPERVLPHLRALCARDPFNENAHASLMRAHAAGGHRAAALRVYDEIRSRLLSDLDLVPGSCLASAYGEIVGLGRGPGEGAARPRSGGETPRADFNRGSGAHPLRDVVIMAPWQQHP
jgi:DNA-binding SARP family transcriptional activator